MLKLLKIEIKRLLLPLLIPLGLVVSYAFFCGLLQLVDGNVLESGVFKARNNVYWAILLYLIYAMLYIVISATLRQYKGMEIMYTTKLNVNDSLLYRLLGVVIAAAAVCAACMVANLFTDLGAQYGVNASDVGEEGVQFIFQSFVSGNRIVSFLFAVGYALFTAELFLLAVSFKWLVAKFKEKSIKISVGILYGIWGLFNILYLPYMIGAHTRNQISDFVYLGKHVPLSLFEYSNLNRTGFPSSMYIPTKTFPFTVNVLNIYILMFTVLYIVGLLALGAMSLDTPISAAVNGSKLNRKVLKALPIASAAASLLVILVCMFGGAL